MGATGPGIITQLNFNSGAPTVDAKFIEGFSLSNAPDSYESSRGIPVERGSIRKEVAGTLLDYSAFSSLNTLMTGRTEHDLVITYVDASTQTLSDGIVTVVPVSNVVTDVVKVLIAAAGATKTDLDAGTGWTDLGLAVEQVSITYDFPYNADSSKGKPYYSTVRAQGEIVFPDATYADLNSIVGSAADLAFQLPDGNWQCLDDVYPYRHYSGEDGNTPRGTRLMFTAVSDSWGDILSYHDGSSASATPGDYFAGGQFTYVGYKYSEGSLVTWV